MFDGMDGFEMMTDSRMAAPTMDALKVMQLAGWFNAALRRDLVMDFEEYVRRVKSGELDGEEANPFVYVGEAYGYEVDDIAEQVVIDMLVDEMHEDVVSRSDDYLQTVKVRIEVDDDGDVSFAVYDRSYETGKPYNGEAVYM